MYDYIKRIAMLMISSSMIFVVSAELSIAEDLEVIGFRAGGQQGPHLKKTDKITISPVGNSKQYWICPTKAKSYGRECRMLRRISGKLPQEKLDSLTKRRADTKVAVEGALKETLREVEMDLDQIATTYLLEIYADGHDHDFLVWLIEYPTEDEEPSLIIDGNGSHVNPESKYHDGTPEDHGGAAHLS